MNVKRMRIQKGGTAKCVKKVLTKKSGVVENMYNFCKTLMEDGVSQDGLIQGSLSNPQYEIGKWARGVIYDSDSIDDNTYDYCGFEMDYEVTGSIGQVEIPAAGKTILANGEIITGTCSGVLERETFKILESQEPESGTGTVTGTVVKICEVNAVGLTWRTGIPQEVGHEDVVFTIKRLTFIK